MNKPQFIIVHHCGGTDANPLADSSNQTFAEVNEYHRTHFNEKTKSSLGFYLGYHYFIDKEGNVTQARADTDTGAHTIGINDSSLGVCLAGNFDLTVPTTAQTKSLQRLLQEKSAQYGISRIVPHRHFASKTCYGMNLGDRWAENLTCSYIMQLIHSLMDILGNLNAKKVGLSERNNSCI